MYSLSLDWKKKFTNLMHLLKVKLFAGKVSLSHLLMHPVEYHVACFKAHGQEMLEYFRLKEIYHWLILLLPGSSSRIFKFLIHIICNVSLNFYIIKVFCIKFLRYFFLIQVLIINYSILHLPIWQNIITKHLYSFFW